MKIVFDLTHPCDINFFKNVIELLKKKGHTIFIIALKRDPVPKIVRKELSEYRTFFVGKHRGNLLSIIFEANIFKFFKLLFLLLKLRPDIGISFGSFILGFVLKLFNRYNVQFYDDPENKKNKILQKISSDRLFYPPFNMNDNKIETFNSLKEWAYLSPKYFNPDYNSLVPYDIEPQKYIFIREVITGTMNYRNQISNLISIIAEEFPKSFKVVLSLEDKTNINLYPKQWILLKEPVSDIHSLMYYSKCIVSSGDSMAREGAILGVPSVYCGSRKMAANQILIQKNILFHVDYKDVSKLVKKLTLNNEFCSNQEEFRNALLIEWDDVTEFIYTKIKEWQKMGIR